MISTIENAFIKVGVKHFGATLTSIRSKRTDFEFLWQGNPDIWNGQSPILFPIIGRLLDDKCIIDGREYSIIRHGLARHNSFDLVKKSDSSLTFLQRENSETLKSFPFGYELEVRFDIAENTLNVTHTVRNTNEKPMPFSIGAHPAFNCEIGDEIHFEKAETAYCERIDTSSLLTEDKDLILDGTDTLTIAEDTFAKDVMIFSDLKSKYVTLQSKSCDRSIRFDFYNAPFFSVWAKENAPFVCLEPWYGINDSYRKAADFSQKRGNITLAPQEEFSFRWTAEFNG